MRYVLDAQYTHGTQISTCGRAGPIPRYQRMSSVWTRLRGYGEASASGKNIEARRTGACDQSYVSRVRYHGPAKCRIARHVRDSSIPLTVDGTARPHQGVHQVGRNSRAVTAMELCHEMELSACVLVACAYQE